MITQAYLRQILSYDPDTGVFRWLHPRRAGIEIAGCTHSHGYIVISIENRQHRAHRLAYLYMTGEWPASEIDHANGERADNRWANLRIASRSQNRANAKVSKASQIGLKGVLRDNRDGIYSGRIQHNHKTIHLGRFKTAEEAHRAYAVAARIYFREFARAK